MGDHILQACQQVVKELRPILPTFASLPAGACRTALPAVKEVIASGPCKTFAKGKRLGSCLIGGERHRLANVLAGNASGDANALTARDSIHLSRHDALIRLLSRTRSESAYKAHARAFRGGTITPEALLDLALAVDHHQHVRDHLHNLYPHLGTLGIHFLRLTMRHGYLYHPRGDLRAARTLALHIKDAEARAWLQQTAMVKAPQSGGSLALYGRTAMAINGLLHSITGGSAPQLADVLLHAPIFHDPQFPRVSMAATQDYRAGVIARMIIQPEGTHALGETLKRHLQGNAVDDRRARQIIDILEALSVHGEKPEYQNAATALLRSLQHPPPAVDTR